MLLPHSLPQFPGVGCLFPETGGGSRGGLPGLSHRVCSALSIHGVASVARSLHANDPGVAPL